MATRTDLFGVLLEEIVIEDGFNVRFDMGDLRELMESIVELGIKNPIHAYQKKGDINRYTLLEGHRRIAAVKLAVSEGKLDAKVFRIPMVKERNMSDVDRVLGLVTYNSGKPLHMLEEAAAYQKAVAYGATPAEIAKRVGKSPTHIANCLILLTAGKPTQQMIREGNVAPTNVLSMLRTKEPSVVDKELADALTEKKEAIRKEKPQLSLADYVDSMPSVLGGANTEDNDLPALEDNTKSAGVSGMDAQLSDSGKPIKLTKKNLDKKEPKAETYTKEFILKLLADNDVSEDEVAYVILAQELK